MVEFFAGIVLAIIILFIAAAVVAGLMFVFWIVAMVIGIIVSAFRNLV